MSKPISLQLAILVFIGLFLTLAPLFYLANQLETSKLATIAQIRSVAGTSFYSKEVNHEARDKLYQLDPEFENIEAWRQIFNQYETESLKVEFNKELPADISVSLTTELHILRTDTDQEHTTKVLSLFSNPETFKENINQDLYLMGPKYNIKLRLKVRYQIKTSYLFQKNISSVLITSLFVFLSWWVLLTFMRSWWRQQKFYQQQSDFIDHVSHELGTPVTALTMALEQSFDKRDKKDPIAGIVFRHLNRLKLISESSRKLTLLENTRPALNQIDIAHWLQSKGEQWHSGYDNILLNIETQHQSLSIDIDEHLLEMAITNLLNNAQNLTEEKVKVSINLHSNNSTHWIDVCNSGPALKAIQLQDLFQRFSPSTTSGGLGLGLYLTKRYCQLMNCDITLSHNENGHVCFQLSLPKEKS